MKNLIRAILAVLGAMTFVVLMLLGLSLYRRNTLASVADLSQKTKEPLASINDDDINDEDFRDLNDRNAYSGKPEDVAEQFGSAALSASDNEEVRSVAS